MSNQTKQPLVSALMVTANRASLAKRAALCLAAQTWRNIELVIIDDGDEDYTTILEPHRQRFAINYQRIEKEPGRRLGALRNLALEAASGDYMIQWDDDEWYHPERIATQMAALCAQNLDACVLRKTLMHLNTPQFLGTPFRGDAASGTPGTILHKRTTVRYPNIPRAEDSVFLDRLAKVSRVGEVRDDHGHLFIRCFHGGNTWGQRHFLKRLRRTPRLAASYLWARFVLGDIKRHPAFELTAEEALATEHFLDQSRELGLLAA